MRVAAQVPQCMFGAAKGTFAVDDPFHEERGRSDRGARRFATSQWLQYAALAAVETVGLDASQESCEWLHLRENLAAANLTIPTHLIARLNAVGSSATA